MEAGASARLRGPAGEAAERPAALEGEAGAASWEILAASQRQVLRTLGGEKHFLTWFA